MAWYIVRQSNNRFALFDDLTVEFVSSSMLLGEAAGKYMSLAGCNELTAFRNASVAQRDLSLQGFETADDRHGSRMNEVLTAIMLIKGRRVLLEQMSIVGDCAGMPDIEAGCSDLVVELCDAYGVTIPSWLAAPADIYRRVIGSESGLQA